MRMREMQILQDREGWYIADEDGWDLCRTYRFVSFKQAEAKLSEWNAEDVQQLDIEERAP